MLTANHLRVTSLPLSSRGQRLAFGRNDGKRLHIEFEGLLRQWSWGLTVEPEKHGRLSLIEVATSNGTSRMIDPMAPRSKLIAPAVPEIVP